MKWFGITQFLLMWEHISSLPEESLDRYFCFYLSRVLSLHWVRSTCCVRAQVNRGRQRGVCAGPSGGPDSPLCTQHLQDWRWNSPDTFSFLDGCKSLSQKCCCIHDSVYMSSGTQGICNYHLYLMTPFLEFLCPVFDNCMLFSLSLPPSHPSPFPTLLPLYHFLPPAVVYFFHLPLDPYPDTNPLQLTIDEH